MQGLLINLKLRLLNQKDLLQEIHQPRGFTMIVIDLNGDNLTDEFNAVLFKYIKYCNSPAIASTTSVHNF
jgi:hypothetical protein